jgi:hypothetical protein
MPKAIKIIVKQSGIGRISSSETVSVDSLPITTNRMDHLADVNASGEIKGATVVYDPDTDTYFVKKLNFADIDGDAGDIGITEIDGGNF